MRVRVSRKGLGLASAVVAIALFGVSPTPQGSFEVGAAAHAQSKGLSKGTKTIEVANKRLTELEDRYLKPELVNAEFSLETRFNDARVAYELAQYDRSSYLFLDIISRAPPSFPGYRSAHYFLADSLIKQRNFIGARTYLRELVALGPGEYYQEGLAKLLELAYQTNNYEGVSDIYSKLDMGREESAALSYLRGKTLYQQASYDAAQGFFLKAAATPEFSYKGRYFAAVALVAQGKLEEATKLFLKLTEKIPLELEDVRIYYLAYLSLGRLAYEQGNYQEALQYYSRLDRDDPNFIKAMYETAWTNIQLEKWEQAGRMIDILLQAEPDPNTYANALLLKADLSMRTKDYEAALGAYETVLERYDPVKQELDRFALAHQDLRGFFQDLVRDDLTMATPEGLPSIRTDFKVISPQEWLTGEARLQRTTRMVDDVGITRVNLLSAVDDLDQIDARLNSGAAVKSFPKLAEGVALVTEVESELITLQQLLVNALAADISPRLSGADRTQWDGMRVKLDTLQQRYEAIPKTADSLEGREAQVAIDFRRLREQLNEVGYSIDQMRAELSAIDTYLQMQDVTLSGEELAKVNSLREEVRATIGELEGEQMRLRAEIARARESIGSGGVVTGSERKLRQLYVKQLAEASSLLLRNRSLARDAGQLSQAERLREQLPGVHGRIARFYEQMDNVVEGKATGARATIANLRKMLDDQLAELDAVALDSRGVAADIAMQTFLSKQREFDGLIERADVGKIDAMFQRKENSTNTINDLFKQRTDELRALQEAFEEVR